MSRATGVLDVDVDKTLGEAAAAVKCQPGTPDRADSEFLFENGVFPARAGTPEHHWGPYSGQQATSMIVAAVEVVSHDFTEGMIAKDIAICSSFEFARNIQCHVGGFLSNHGDGLGDDHALGLKGEGGRVEMLEMGVMNTIFDAISKEGFVNKLIIPLNDYLEMKHVVSNWEWQKNKALLELEQRNQLLQHLLREAGEQVKEAKGVAQYDRKNLETALKKGKDELYLIGRAEAMRTRLIEQKQIIARFHTISMCLLSWQRFTHGHRKKKILRKLQLLWIRVMLTKTFEGFLRGCLSIKHRRQMKDKGCSYWMKTSVGKHFQAWLMHIRGRKELKEKVKGFVQSWTTRRLRVAFRGWRGNYLRKGWKQLQQKKAGQVWSFSHLRKAWHGWDQQVVLAKDKNCSAEDFLFRRLASGCFSRWWRYIQLKLLPSKRSLLFINTLESRSHQMAFNSWNHKISLSVLVRERVLHFVKHRTRKSQQLILTKWHQLVSRTRHVESVEKVVLWKSIVWLKRRAFGELKRHWIEMRVLRRRQTLRSFRTTLGRGEMPCASGRLASFRRWTARIQRLKAVKRRVLQIQQRLRHRSQQKLFDLWVVFATNSRKFAIAKEANKLAERVNLLESDLDVAKKVRHQLEKSIVELENEKVEVRKVAQKAIVSTSVCKNGLLEVDIRWRIPSLEWLPPSCAGHTAVSLPGKHETCCSQIVLFGGYNGENCFNQVFIFDTDTMHWNAAASSAANGSVIPRAMLTHTACVLGNNKMVIFGGYDGAQEFSDVSMMKLSDDGLACEWSQPQILGGTKPGPMCQHTSCLYEDGPYMVVYGGYRSEEGLLNEVWVLDLHLLRWSCPEYHGTPPEPRRGHGAGMVGTKMYIFGGYNGREHLADFHALDIKTMTWECIQAQSQGPSARRQHSVTVVGQHLVVYGGYDGKRYLGDLFSFDTTQSWWKRWPDQETDLHLDETGLGGQVCGRSMHTMVEAGQRLVIFGGVHDWGALQEMIFLENPAATESLQLRKSLFDEHQKLIDFQAQLTGYKKVMREIAIEQAGSQNTQEQLRSILRVESEKKKKAVQSYRALTRKLQKARAASR